MALVVNNNFRSRLKSAITDSDVTIYIEDSDYKSALSGHSDGDYFYAKLRGPESYEYIKVNITGSSVDAGLQVERGQAGSSAAAWKRGTLCFQSLEATTFGLFPQKAGYSSGAYNPNGTLTADYKGQLFWDSANSCWWKSISASTEWRLVAGEILVATPAFSPEAGSYDPGQAVTITCATGGATIYYTTDGSTPTENSTQYTAPVAMPTGAATTLKAIAVHSDRWLTDSAVQSGVYTISGLTFTNCADWVLKETIFNDGWKYNYVREVLYLSDGVALACAIHTVNRGSAIYRTADSGENWSKVKEFASDNVNSMCRVSSTIAAIQTVKSTNVGEIHRSTDSGENWSKVHDYTLNQAYNSDLGITNSYMAADGSGVAITQSYHVPSGTEPYLYRSSDSGANWSSVGSLDTMGPSYYRDVTWVNGTTYCAGCISGEIWLSGNSGTSWAKVKDTAHVDEQIYSIASDGAGVVVAGSGRFGVVPKIYISTDYGQNWSTAQSLTGYTSYYVTSIDYMTTGVFIATANYLSGYSGEETITLYSDDYGESWTAFCAMSSIPETSPRGTIAKMSSTKAVVGIFNSAKLYVGDFSS
jgi:photosystem II stability/assembly factor-like uncharacterized protein